MKKNDLNLTPIFLMLSILANIILFQELNLRKTDEVIGCQQEVEWKEKDFNYLRDTIFSDTIVTHFGNHPGSITWDTLAIIEVKIEIDSINKL
ncbi:MAG: hypothetical protein KBD26_00090 [Candidatus Pacebacteria bacterium]|nr:hypothetical protein [Candidatus Paceibacterota bacterium]MBP9772215.1 hypothetical protein [Candidatus Paceibacterota bacterium]